MYGRRTEIVLVRFPKVQHVAVGVLCSVRQTPSSRAQFWLIRNSIFSTRMSGNSRSRPDSISAAAWRREQMESENLMVFVVVHLSSGFARQEQPVANQ